MQYGKFQKIEAANYSDFRSFFATAAVTIFVQATNLKLLLTNKMYASAIAY